MLIRKYLAIEFKFFFLLLQSGNHSQVSCDGQHTAKWSNSGFEWPHPVDCEDVTEVLKFLLCCVI